MTKDEALKMAIEAMRSKENYFMDRAIQACKEALEQPAQEPVAWMSEGGIFTRTKEHAESWSNHGGKVTPVYTHPTPSWQGLSDDEIGRLAVFDGLHHVEIPLLAKFIRAIEQAIKEKNPNLSGH